MCPMSLIALWIISLTWRSKASLLSNNKPKCLPVSQLVTARSSVFEIIKSVYDTSHFQDVSNESRRTVNCGLETICYKASFAWENNSFGI